ncbi:MAG TPA: hypothetical protein VJA26_04785 [Gammaproteobacteria bacterium]|nr:hypothetical protein [Gammaproteobacteria bacterium]
MLQVCRYSDARAFLMRAESWLLGAEIQHAMALESARHARSDDSHYQKPVFWATVEDDSRIIGCAFRTPPYRVGVTDLPIAAIPPLVASLREFYSTLPGISGPEPAASELARAWTERYGGAWSVHSRQRLLSLASVEPLNDAPEGLLRLAADADAPVAHAWGTALARDSGVTALDGAFCARLIRGDSFTSGTTECRAAWLACSGRPRKRRQSVSYTRLPSCAANISRPTPSPR